MLLEGKPVVADLDLATKQYINQNGLVGKYVAFFLLSDDAPSEVYVQLKAKKAKKIGLYGDIVLGKDWSLEEVIDEISTKNNDDACVGIVVQLPLAAHLEPYRATILSAVVPHKDLDGLGGVVFGLSSIGKIDFVPATPKAVLELLSFYQVDQFEGKVISLLGQSDLIGKPLAVELMKRGATVLMFNAESDQELMKDACRNSAYIISATGVVHLVDDAFISSGGDQIVVDVGRGIRDDKAVGDTCREQLESKVKAITPVPGGIGPVTVSSLFHNIVVLGEQYDLLV